MSGLPALPIAEILPSLRPTSALTMPQWSRISALVMTVSTAPCAVGDLALPHAVADHLAAAEFHLLAVNGEILLDLDDEVGVGEPHFVARGGAEHVRIGRAFHRYGIFLSSHLSTAFRKLLARPRDGARLRDRSLMVGSGRTRMAAKAGVSSRRGCPSGYLWLKACRSWLSVTGYGAAGSRWRTGDGSESL